MAEKKSKPVGVIALFTSLLVAITPLAVAVLGTPNVTVSGDNSFAAGGDINIFSNPGEAWITGAKRILGIEQKEPNKGDFLKPQPESLPEVKGEKDAVPPLSKNPEEIKKVGVGRLIFGFHGIQVRPRPGGTPNRDQWAFMGLDITNTGSSPVQVAIVREWPVLQVDGAIEFRVRRPPGITGVEVLDEDSIDYCGQNAKDFTRLNPGQTIAANIPFETDLHGGSFDDGILGRVGGAIMVYSPEDKSCIKDSFTATELPITIYR